MVWPQWYSARPWRRLPATRRSGRGIVCLLLARFDVVRNTSFRSELQVHREGEKVA